MLKHLPQSERLLQGKLNADLSIVATEANVDTPPSSDKLPTYIEFEPDSDQVELCRITGVSGNIITLERGLNNGGVGIAHLTNAAYEQKFTSRHYQAVVDALESGFLTEDESYSLAKVDTDTFTITTVGEDITADYQAGRIIRLNGTNVGIVLSSSYISNVNTINLSQGTIPSSITSVEIAIQPSGMYDLVSALKASAAEINAGTNDTKIITPKGAKDSDIAFLTDMPAVATAAEIAAGTDNAKFASALSLVNTFGHSLFRQALVNGNFDIWQRGASVAMTTANAYTADRWYCETATAGTDKTVSQQDGTGVNGSYYCARVAMVQDVDELLTFSQALESKDSIKFRGKKITLSFYARGGAEFVADNSTLVSKIVTGKGTDQKVLAFTTSADAVSQNNTLTTSWQKFTCTTSAVIASDITQIGISLAFTHAGSGVTTNYFEVTQVQLCAGDVALPFMPKSYDDEFMACQRFFQSYSFTNGGNIVFGLSYAASGASFAFMFKSRLRSIPTTCTLSGTMTVGDGGSTGTSTTFTYPAQSVDMMNVNVSSISGSPLTTGRSAALSSSNGSLIVDSEF